MKFLLFPLLLIATLTAGTFAWRAHRQAAAAQTALASLQAQRPLVDGKIHAAAARIAQAQKNAADLRARLQPPSTSKAPTSIAPRPALRDPSRMTEDNPKLQNLQLAARRAQLAITYATFYREAGLSPQQIDDFELNLMRREERQSDLFAVATAEGTLLNTNAAFLKLMAQAESDYQAAQLAVLGESRARQLRDYERLANIRETVSGMAGAAAMAGTPLTTEQAEQLTRTLANASPAYAKGENVYPSSLDWHLVHEQAKTFLSDAQLTFIETTESSGPRGSGSRFLPQLNATITAAAEEEAAKTAMP